MYDSLLILTGLHKSFVLLLNIFYPFTIQGLDSTNAFSRLAQKSANKFPEYEEEESSGSRGDDESTSESNDESFSGGSANDLGGIVSEDGLEVETRHDEGPTVEVAPVGDLEMDVDNTANQMWKILRRPLAQS